MWLRTWPAPAMVAQVAAKGDASMTRVRYESWGHSDHGTAGRHRRLKLLPLGITIEWHRYVHTYHLPPQRVVNQFSVIRDGWPW